MRRLIDADEFDKELLSGWISQALGVSHRRKYTIGEIRGMIQKRQTIDAVPVVRCKDCKHRDPEDKKCDSGHSIQWQLPRDDDWFCADGEKVKES